ncbi:hypothetical protein [Pararhizobium arenae]|uniref:hypothetical protein n=1 Tax=Pararhizobium arenae TaxID=1856850 RepID=UPI00094B64D4|nr:hypothetical protein [Pararhizobium arenae]
MTHYAWTIEAKGRLPIKKVTILEGLHVVLRVLGRPGFFPLDWPAAEVGISDHGKYTYDEGGVDKWSLTWTRVGLHTIRAAMTGLLRDQALPHDDGDSWLGLI